jgi:hypothetical protein
VFLLGFLFHVLIEREILSSQFLGLSFEEESCFFTVFYSEF